MKNETNTDMWVRTKLEESGIYGEGKITYQSTDNFEILQALKTASKKQTGNRGTPDFVGIIKDFLIIIEDKRDLTKHIVFNDKNLISESSKDIENYAVNGALFYGKHLVKNTSYNKVFAIGVSGDEKNNKITPVFLNERGDYIILNDLKTFISFNEKNIEEYYIKEILKESTDNEKEEVDIINDAKILHEDLRNYGNIEEKNKPLIVSGILLALREIENSNFSIESLNGDDRKTDGQKIYDAIKANLYRANVTPETKRDKLLSQFSIIKDNIKINQINSSLNKTPLKHYTQFLYDSIFQSIRYSSSAEDYLGRFYGEFMSYSGGDGQNLGIILTPKHITQLFCDLLKLEPTDKVLDPCCGTAGFLIAAMHNMLLKTNDDILKEEIKKNNLIGIEVQPYMFAIATTNMILRGDGKSNLINDDFLEKNPNELQLKGCTVGMMNPPYSMGSTKRPDLYEIKFIKHLLDSLTPNGRAAVIVPQSTFTQTNNIQQITKEAILKEHTLEGVITLHKNTFYGVGTTPCIAIFKAHTPHRNKESKFINFEDDGYVVSKHRGLIDDGTHKDKKQQLLDVWFNDKESSSKYCIKTTIKATDEWLHSFYYFNEEIPTEKDFENVVADYLAFEVDMIVHDREYLFKENSNLPIDKD